MRRRNLNPLPRGKEWGLYIDKELKTFVMALAKKHRVPMRLIIEAAIRNALKPGAKLEIPGTDDIVVRP